MLPGRSGWRNGRNNVANDWGSVHGTDNDGKPSWHVLPLIDIDGEKLASAAHDASPTCHCGPFPEKAKGGWNVWHHLEPEHPGAMTIDEFLARKKKALTIT